MASVTEQRGALGAVKELTIRGIILGALITVVFTAANVYLGLKIGITFATSIPAAVISMAVLKAFRDATIQENNIVQTIASAAGTLSAIVFVLPGLIMPSAIWSMRFFSRPIHTATPIAIADVSATSIQRPTGFVALSRPSEMPLFSV